MNYKVMQRPMFKMGGKANSQGTGITSGLDEKVNMVDGRANYSNGPMTRQDFLKRALSKIEQREKAMKGMDNLINLGAFNRASQVLAEETSNNPLDIIANIAKQGTSIALPALSEKKKLELKRLDPTTDLAIAKALKTSGGFGQKVYEMKLENLGKLENQMIEINKQLQEGTITPEEYNRLKGNIDRRMKLISGSFETEGDIRSMLYQQFVEQNGVAPNKEQLDREVEKYKESMGLANGGRVDRQMGSPMGGEQPLPEDPTKPVNPFQPKPIAPFPSKAEGQGDNVFAMLRARLPQEITDEVVSLIAYNKEAFADFASIKNQEDVNSFNEKYGVELVIDVATV